MTVATAPASTFAELFANLETKALNLMESIKNEAVVLEHAIVPVLESDVATFLSQFENVALDTVKTMATQAFANLTGSQKNLITVNTIVQAAVASGKAVALQDAQMLAQQAFYAFAKALPVK